MAVPGRGHPGCHRVTARRGLTGRPVGAVSTAGTGVHVRRRREAVAHRESPGARWIRCGGGVDTVGVMRNRWSASLATLGFLTLAGCSSSSLDDADPTPGQASDDQLAPAAADDGRDGAEHTASSTRGGIELAVSRTCSPGSEPECVLVNGEHVTVIPSHFVRVGVEHAVAVADGEGNESIELRFDDEGTATLESSSAQVAGVGQDGRLVMKVGDRVLSAVRVPAALETSEVRIALPPDAGADAVIEHIRAG